MIKVSAVQRTRCVHHRTTHPSRGKGLHRRRGFARISGHLWPACAALADRPALELVQSNAVRHVGEPAGHRMIALTASDLNVGDAGREQFINGRGHHPKRLSGPCGSMKGALPPLSRSAKGGRIVISSVIGREYYKPVPELVGIAALRLIELQA